MTAGRDPNNVLDQDILAQLHALDEPGEATLLSELIVVFRGWAPGQMQRLQTALAAGHAAAFGDAAHALKGCAGSVGALRMQTAAGDLERLGLSDDLVNAGVQLGHLEAIYTEALEALAHEEARQKQELAG
jgi:two-component system sensor histidine kinase/response regulator